MASRMLAATGRRARRAWRWLVGESWKRSLARLAVDREFQGRRLGELLLLNALERSRRIHREAGGMALFVDALDEGAVDWYRRFEFAAAPENPLLLFLPVAAIGELLP